LNIIATEALIMAERASGVGDEDRNGGMLWRSLDSSTVSL
jgi:hypothetical protein